MSSLRVKLECDHIIACGGLGISGGNTDVPEEYKHMKAEYCDAFWDGVMYAQSRINKSLGEDRSTKNWL